MKRILALVLCGILGGFLFSCQKDGFDGFYEEDLARYLTLGEYRGLTYASETITVSDEEIDAEIEKKLEAATTYLPTDKPIEPGFALTVDRYCLIGGEAVPSLSETGKHLVCGTDYADPVLEAILTALVGVRVGETKEIGVTLPENYLDGGRPASEAVYRVSVVSVYEKKVPLLNDETASTLMPGCESVDALRLAISAALMTAKEAEAAYRAEASLWTRVMESSVLIETPYDLYLDIYAEKQQVYLRNAEASSMSLSEYLNTALGIDEEELSERLATQARAQIKEQMVLYSIVKKEGIVATEEQVMNFASLCAIDSDGVFVSGDDYLAYYGKEYVTELYLKELTLQRIFSYAVQPVAK